MNKPMTLRNLSETYASAVADQTVLKGKAIVPEDVCHAFCDGFKAAQEQFTKGAEKSFEEYTSWLSDYYHGSDERLVHDKKVWVAAAVPRDAEIQKLRQELDEARGRFWIVKEKLLCITDTDYLNDDGSPNEKFYLLFPDHDEQEHKETINKTREVRV